MKYRITLLLLVLNAHLTIAQSDTTRFMHSYASVNVGYAINLRSGTDSKFVDPFWGKNGLSFSATGLFALKSSYFGIPVTFGYFSPPFNVGAYLGFNGDTSSNYPYRSLGPNKYDVYYLMGGLNLKLPQRTSAVALELRFTVGPLFINQSEIQYSYSIPSASNVVYIDIKHSTVAALGINPGVGLGSLVSKRIALMVNADLLIAEFKYRTLMSAIDNASSNNQQITMRSTLFYGSISASLIYTFGKMTPNISY